MAEEIDLSHITGFDWDEGNRTKNVLEHQVENNECEEVFFNDPVCLRDIAHSQVEERFHAFGITNTARLLSIVFTVRGDKIRVISARDQNKKERPYYYQQRKDGK